MNLICIMTAQGNGMVFIVAGLDKAVFSGLYYNNKTMKTTISNDVLSAAIAAVRTKSPLVHSITNYVVMNNSANALLSIGASPVMAHWKDEMEEMTAISGAMTKLPSKRVHTRNTHGTGCTLSSAFAAALAKGEDLTAAAVSAKKYIEQAIISGADYEIGGGHGPVNHFWSMG